ncbi:MAG TPA: AAA family ATPase [Burkholderiaceae bacterium]|nr:AAA family ATPase [Burkholderiaceae bacterium]
MADIFRRPALAAEMAGQLLRPGPLNEGLRSGLFLPGLRRTGKTTFVLQDLAPALEQAGAVVIYADLWSDPQADPAVLVHGAIRRTLDALRSPGSALLQRLRALKSLDLAAGALKFGFEVESLGAPGGVTLAAALTQVVDQARTDVVLIVDEVQHALSSEQGGQLLYALKAARDAINPRPGTPGHFLFIGTGSHRAQVGELTARRNQAFAGATSIAYPVLGEDYVAHLLARLREAGVAPLPSRAVAHAAFGALGHRPEEMLKALRHLHLHVPKHADPDTHLPAIAAAMRTHAADIELAKVEQLGGLAQAVFDRIAGTRGDTPGVFTGEALADYGRAVGREVRTEEVQSTLNALLDANVVMRRGHGQYVVTDPFVQQTWTERRALP